MNKKELCGIEFFESESVDFSKFDFIKNKILVNVDFFKELKINEKKFVLNHEFFHKIQKDMVVKWSFLIIPSVIIFINFLYPISWYDTLILLSILCLSCRYMERKADEYGYAKAGIMPSINALKKLNEYKVKNPFNRIMNDITHYSYKNRIKHLKNKNRLT